ncbi:hypothetical protein BKA69DRAFT_475261 [Paraphysoderma sedebokerense]|nr:hypothetical protein BKA69DRAFT_475261 [Paraphysoderma sedebokerense]
MVPPNLPDSRRSSVQPKLTSFFSLPSTDDTSMVTSNTDTLEHPSSTDSNITQAAAESDVTCSRHRVSATNSASAYRTVAIRTMTATMTMMRTTTRRRELTLLLTMTMMTTTDCHLGKG